MQIFVVDVEMFVGLFCLNGFLFMGVQLVDSMNEFFCFYKCIMCDKVFYCFEYQICYIWMYIGEKLYVCYYLGCSKRFLCLDELMRYLRIYNNFNFRRGNKGYQYVGLVYRLQFDVMFLLQFKMICLVFLIVIFFFNVLFFYYYLYNFFFQFMLSLYYCNVFGSQSGFDIQMLVRVVG